MLYCIRRRIQPILVICFIFLLGASKSVAQEGAGSCLDFDGNNDYVDVSNTTDFQFVNESFSITCWARIVDNPNNYRGFVYWGDSTDNWPRIQLVKYRSGAFQGRIAFQVGNASGSISQVFTIQSGAELPKDQWFHLAAVVNVPASEIYLYLDGVPQDTASLVNYDLSVANNLKLSFGLTDGKNMSGYHNDVIDEVRIWHKALSINEVRDNMTQVLQGTEPQLTGYWRFDDGSGTIANDSSPNNNNGTLN